MDEIHFHRSWTSLEPPASAMQRTAPIALEDGWETVRRGVDKLEMLLEGDPEAEGFKAEEYMNIYTCVLGSEHGTKPRKTRLRSRADERRRN